MSSTIQLSDPNYPENSAIRFEVSENFETELSNFFGKKIVGIYDEIDHVYYPIRFISLKPSYFETRGNLSVVPSAQAKNLTAQSSISKPSTDNDKIIAAHKIFSALDLTKSGRLNKNHMSTYLTAAFEYLFKVLGEADDVCSPSDLAIATAADCFGFTGGDNPREISFEDFHAWFSANEFSNNQKEIKLELRNLMTQAIQIYLNPLDINLSSQRDTNEEENNLSLEEAIEGMRKLSGLNNFAVAEIIRFFLTQCDASNCLDRESFRILFEHIRGDSFVNSDFIDILFETFDYCNEGFISIIDFGNCLPLFCSDTPEEQAHIVFQLSDHDQDQRLSAKELFLYLKSTTQFMYQLSRDVGAMYGDKTPSEIAWISAIAAFEMNGKQIKSSDYDTNNSTLSTKTGADSLEYLTFEEFKHWYLYGGGLHIASWTKFPDPSPKSPTELLFDPKFDNFRENFAIDILGAKNLFPLKHYSASILSSFFCTLAEGNGTISESSFYHGFDKLIKTKKTPGNDIKPTDQLAIDNSIAKIYSAYDPDGRGYIGVFDLVCGLLMFCDDDIFARAQAMLSTMLWVLSETDVENIQSIAESEVGAAILSILRMFIAFNPTPENEAELRESSPEYIAAAITISACSKDEDEENSLLVEKFCNLIASVYAGFDDGDFKYISASNFERYIEAVSWRASAYDEENTTDSSSSSSHDDELDGSAVTDQALYWDGDSATLNSANSISSTVIDELEHAKFLMGFQSLPAEDLMEALGESSVAGEIDFKSFLACIETTSRRSNGIRKYSAQRNELANAIFSCFDRTNCGVAKYPELISGLSTLCDSATGDKLAVSFLSLDESGQGYVSIDAIETFLCSAVKVICVCSPSARSQLMQISRSSIGDIDIPPPVRNSDRQKDLMVLVSAIELVSHDLVNLCYSKGLLQKDEPKITLSQLCGIVEDFQVIASQMSDGFGI